MSDDFKYKNADYYDFSDNTVTERKNSDENNNYDEINYYDNGDKYDEINFIDNNDGNDYCSHQNSFSE